MVVDKRESRRLPAPASPATPATVAPPCTHGLVPDAEDNLYMCEFGRVRMVVRLIAFLGS